MSIADNLKNFKEKLESKPKYTVKQIQSFPVYVFDLSKDLDCDLITNICLSYKSSNDEAKREAVYAWHTPYLKRSKNFIPELEVHLDKIVSKIQKVYEKDFYTYFVDHYWFVVYDKNDFAIAHDHSPSDYVAVFYANVPDNSAPLVLTDISGNIEISVSTGMCVLFPGSVEHSVPKSNHEGNRVIISMNIIKGALKNE